MSIDFPGLGAAGVVSERGFKPCGPAAPASVPRGKADGIDAPRVSSYCPTLDLREVERRGCGHTLRRHVGVADDAVRDRALRTHHDVSTFTDEATAQRVVDEAFAENQRVIGGWLGREKWRNLELHVRAGVPVGRVFRYDRGTFEPSADASVILERTRRLDCGYTVLTAYPRVA